VHLGEQKLAFLFVEVPCIDDLPLFFILDRHRNLVDADLQLTDNALPAAALTFCFRSSKGCLYPMISGRAMSPKVPAPFAWQIHFEEQAPHRQCRKPKNMRRDEQAAVLQSSHQEEQVWWVCPCA